jgi:hypothetical protein
MVVPVGAAETVCARSYLTVRDRMAALEVTEATADSRHRTAVATVVIQGAEATVRSAERPANPVTKVARELDFWALLASGERMGST